LALAARLAGVGDERERADEATERVPGLLTSAKRAFEVLLNMLVLWLEK
jgi:hypothetical protein